MEYLLKKAPGLEFWNLTVSPLRALEGTDSSPCHKCQHLQYF